MTFRDAILEAAGKTTLTKRQRAALERAKAERHPRLWRAFENVVRIRYERDTGKKLPAQFDWSTILDWLITNLPTILPLILTLFA
jgi:hypothetical protein